MNKGEIYQNGKLIIHADFSKTIEAINANKFNLFSKSNATDFDFDPFNYPSGKNLLTLLEDMHPQGLDIQNGQDNIPKYPAILGYDESMFVFPGLEGSSCLTTHCLALHGKREYLPTVMATYYFYTRSKSYSESNSVIRVSQDIEDQMKMDYANDRLKFLTDYVPENSLIFIDGPLIGGNLSNLTLKLNNVLLSKGAIPVFFVKNSNSNLVTDNIESFKNKYNSDMDWAHKSLELGQRSPFFKYQDQVNKENGKIFAYFKTSSLTVQRIEFDLRTFEKYKPIINDILDLSFYLLNVQGNNKNPQIRTIAIAEKYAREVLRYLKDSELGMFNFTPTMNNIRFKR